MTGRSALRPAERQYHALFTEHPQPMWICARDGLRLLAANHAMTRHYGYDTAELLGMDMRALWPPACCASADEADALAIAVCHASHRASLRLGQASRPQRAPQVSP